MKKIPTTENALLIRTDFSDGSVWNALNAVLREPADPFIFNMEIVDDSAYSGATLEQLMAALPDDYPHSFMVVADSQALSAPDQPVLVVDLVEQRGRYFRAVASHIAEIDNNLSIANMGFEEFAGLVDEGGVYRGLPGL